jgi:peptidoglycan/xylan/chitin deacetylase (PgdA/CDA1 family)
MATQPSQGARYLLRFDDMCPTMDWSLWNEVEGLLIEAGVKPILAVIPDNRDPKLMVDPPSPVFWDRVRSWQARGWAIGIHGYQHTYVNAEPGILRLNRRSEFAGLSYEEQLEKLRKGLEVFEREGVHADAWVAPGHSFDWVTVSALTALGIRTISDGMALAPFRDPQGNAWVPQQFANMRPMPFGVWTYCYHLEGLTPAAMTLFRMRLMQLSPRMISLQEAAQMGTKPRSTSDSLVGALRQIVSGIRRLSS